MAFEPKDTPPAGDATPRHPGRIWRDLLEDRSWILRRVETVEFIDASTLRRRVTLDYSPRDLADRSSDLPEDRRALPLCLLAKGLVLDLDIRDSTGASLPAATRELDSDVAFNILTSALEDCGTRVSDLPDSLQRKIRSACFDFPHSADDPEAPASEYQSWALDTTNAEDFETWRALVADNEVFRHYLKMFTFSYLLLTPTSETDRSGHAIVKYAYEDVIEIQSVSPRLVDRLGLAPTLMLVSSPHLGNDRRNHLRVDAPAGMLIVDAELMQLVKGEEAEAPQNLPAPAHPDRLRVSPRRAHWYTVGTGQTGLIAELSLRPYRSGFLRAAHLTALFAFALVSLCYLRADSLALVAEQNADAAIAILLLTPTLLSAVLVRPGEHALLSDYLRGLRYALALAGLCTFSTACSLVLGGSFVIHLVSLLSAVVAGLVAALFTVVTRLVSLELEGVEARSRRTESLVVNVHHEAT